jgi:hypothetical protein
MIKKVRVIFLNAITKSKIMECGGLSPEEANLIIPQSDGFVRINGDWKVAQIVKGIFPNDRQATFEMQVHVFLRKVSGNDYYLM